MTETQSWHLYASADSGDDPAPRFFGPMGFAQRDRTADRVVEILLTAVDDPTDDDYWGWLDHGALQPCHIAATEQEMTRAFLAGVINGLTPRELEESEQGRILRLRIVILGDVALRSGRYNWKIVSAL